MDIFIREDAQIVPTHLPGRNEKLAQGKIIQQSLPKKIRKPQLF